MKILVTGANGLVGRALCVALEQSEHQVIRAVRTSTMPREVPFGDLDENTPWEKVLASGIDMVVHLAARLPPLEGETKTLTNPYLQTNALATAHLARQCAAHGVKRLIFLSTVKVSGEGQGEPYRSEDRVRPADAYAISKHEAEQALWQIARETGMEAVVLRPPLVYGPGVKGNFLRLMQLIDQRRPLPLGAVKNRRSLIYLDNLVDVIRLCLVHPDAAGKTFLVSDGDDVSSPELVRRVADALGRAAFLVPLPVSWMKWAGTLLGQRAAVERLLGSLTVDMTPLQKELGWRPPCTMQAGLAVTAQWYRTTRRKM